MGDNSSWMGDLLRDRPGFGDIPVTQLALAGSHDSGTIHMDERARTQDKTIEEQLHLGLRYFDLRPRLNGNDYYIHHGPLGSDNTLARRPAPSDPDNGPEIFAQIRRFMMANPHEVIIIRYADYSDFTSDQDYVDFVNLMRHYFTFDTKEPTPSKCGLVTLPHGTRPYVNQQTLRKLVDSGERVFVIFEQKDVPKNNPAISNYVFLCKNGNDKDPSEVMVLWDPYWGDASSSLADDDANNVKDRWFPWHKTNITSWNRDGFFVLQSHMQVLNPTGNGAPGYFNKAERSAKATSGLFKYSSGILISNNDRNGDEYLGWLDAGLPMNIITFDFAQYGDLTDKIIAHYRGWRLMPNRAQLGSASWDNKVREERGLSLPQAVRIADADARISFFFYVSGHDLTLTGKGTFPHRTAVFFSGAPQPGTADGYADIYVKRASTAGK